MVGFALVWLSGWADAASQQPVSTQGSVQWQHEVASLLPPASMQKMYMQPAVAQFLRAADMEASAGSGIAAPVSFAAQHITGLSDYEVVLPHATQPPMSRSEQRLLAAYLDNPHQPLLSGFIGVLHLNRSLLTSARYTRPGDALKHSILASYFLHRSQDEGNTASWLSAAIAATEQALTAVRARQAFVSYEETHPAHALFNNTFNYHEENRYLALDRLLLDYYQQPNNVYTAFTLTAGNLWVGGEGDPADPTVLENFVVGSYFGQHAIELAQRLEQAWMVDARTPRFRMASILGGFFALHRRWLAQLIEDPAAIRRIDDEHRQWRLANRAFHAFTVGVAFFEEPENFAEGKAAWEDGFTRCLGMPNPPRTCTDKPRFSFNFAGYVLGYVDYLLKAGQVAQANFYLGLRHAVAQFPYMANYATWDLGRDAWLHREQNANQIAALYADGNPGNDPVHLFLKKRNWGGSTSTCQVCHQAQSTVWTDEQIRLLSTELPPEPEATLGRWPTITTTWYGAPLTR